MGYVYADGRQRWQAERAKMAVRYQRIDFFRCYFVDLFLYKKEDNLINEYIDSLDDYNVYIYENEHATMLFLTNSTSNTTIINTFFK